MCLVGLRYGYSTARCRGRSVTTRHFQHSSFRVVIARLPVHKPDESLSLCRRTVRTGFAGAVGKRLLLPMASVKDIPTIPGELFAKFQTGFFADPVDAVFKALGVQ